MEGMAKPGIASWLLLLFWTGLILMGDTVYAVTTWRQHRAISFTPTVGRIAQSALGRGALGRRGLNLRYTYVVEGVKYTGSRYRYDDANVTVHYANVLEEYPARTRRIIYYDPKNPTDSVLSPGVDGADLLLLLVAAPFNVGTLAVWLAFPGWRRPTPGAKAGGVRIRSEGALLRVRLVDMSAVEAGLYGLGVAAAAESATVIATWGFDTSMRQMWRVWGMALGLAAVVTLWKLLNNTSGRFDLRVDHEAGTVTLPQTGGRSKPATIRLQAFSGVTALRRTSTTPGGHHYSYVPALIFDAPEGGRRIEPLVTWGWREARALAFVEWLSKELVIELCPVEDEKSDINRELIPA